MKDNTSNTNDEGGLNRRETLTALGAATGAVVGIGAFSGSAAAWKRNDVDFKGCSEVWIIVAKEDIDPDKYTPPTVAKVIVETEEGGLDCRTVEFTPETTTTIPGRYGDAPVLKYVASSGEKVLGVIIYNYTEDEDRFWRESPLRANPNRCANTPGTPDPHDAHCADNTFDKTSDILDGHEGSNGKGKGKGKDNGEENGHGKENGKGNGHGKENGKGNGHGKGKGN